MKISDTPQPDASPPDAKVAPPVVTSSRSPKVTTKGAQAADQNKELNEDETEDLAKTVASDIQKPLETESGKEAFGDALDGKSTQTRSSTEQAKTEDAVEDLAQNKQIGELEVKAVKKGSHELEGNKESNLTGPAEDPTLYISEGLTPEEVGDEVQAAVEEIAKEVAETYGIRFDRASFGSFISEIVGSSVTYYVFHTVVNDFYEMQNEDAANEANSERVVREDMIRRRAGRVERRS